jgi:hypothetical protein
MIHMFLAPPSWGRGWGEADFTGRGWGEADFTGRGWGVADFTQRRSGGYFIQWIKFLFLREIKTISIK